MSGNRQGKWVETTTKKQPIKDGLPGGENQECGGQTV
jgi:hypothetical protein